MIFSGGLGRLTLGLFEKPEAELFADIAIQKGVPNDRIIIENASTNTGENVDFTRKLLAEKKLNFESFILIQKPYMERRTLATFMKRWPEKKFIVSSPQIPFDQYPTKEIAREHVINIMVGDLQRIKEYPKRGFQVPQEIPDDVWDAYEKLVALGFDKHLIKD